MIVAWCWLGVSIFGRLTSLIYDSPSSASDSGEVTSLRWNFLDRFSQGVPSRVDRSLMGSMSGAAQSQVTVALKYLGLTDNNGHPKEAMGKLVRSEGETRQKVWKDIIQSSYAFLFSDGFNLQTATPKLLHEQFEKTAGTGATLDRCIAFFLAAAKDADIVLSAYLKEPRKPRGSNGIFKPRTARERPSEQTPKDEWPNDTPKTNTWEEQLLGKFPSFDPAWPDDLKKQWFAGFERLMGAKPQ